MPRKKSDPMLKIAMHEINQILEKFDLAANICLVSKTHSASTMRFPEWSSGEVIRDEKGREARIEMSIDVGTLGKRESKRRAEAFVKIVNEMGMHSFATVQQMRDLMEQMESIMEKQTRFVSLCNTEFPKPNTGHSIILNHKEA